MERIRTGSFSFAGRKLKPLVRSPAGKGLSMSQFESADDTARPDALPTNAPVAPSKPPTERADDAKVPRSKNADKPAAGAQMPRSKAADRPASGAQATSMKNTNKWETRQLVTMALLCAIGVLLSFIEFPLIPGVTWLKYDASAMPAMVCGFAFGAGGGLAVGIAGAVIHGLLMADFSGAVMNILVVIGFVVPAAVIYNHGRTFPRAIAGLVVSVICAVLMAVVGNLIITPSWLGVPLDAVIAMILPILTPFNLLKGVINAVLTLAIYKSISNLITPRKKQVKGR